MLVLFGLVAVILLAPLLGSLTGATHASPKRNSLADPPVVLLDPEPSILEVDLGVSWYGMQFKGKPTASRVPFNPFELTAAHREWPFGTIIELTNPDNGASVRVEVNDRGPYRDTHLRHLDVSLAAAARLGIVNDGIRVGDRALKARVWFPQDLRKRPAA